MRTGLSIKYTPDSSFFPESSRYYEAFEKFRALTPPISCLILSYTHRTDRITREMHLSTLTIVGVLAIVQGILHELIVGNFVNNVLYTLSFDSETYTLDLIANISVETKNSWIALSVRVSHSLPATRYLSWQ